MQGSRGRCMARWNPACGLHAKCWTDATVAAKTKPLSTLLEKVAAVAPNLLGRNTRLLVAVSGGIDSMVLLHVLQRLASAQGWQLTVAHLNHKLRGRSSDADQRLVENTTRELKLPIVLERGDVRAMAKSGNVSIEMAARQMRHAFLAATAKENGIETIVTAHHADDQVELFFLRLLRGAGADGLSGMEPLSTSPADPEIKIARPLLDVTREGIEHYARAEGVRWREDASNDSMDHARNRVRHKLLPLVRREFQPAIREVVLRTIELLEPEADFSATAALQWLRQPDKPFDKLHKAVQRRVLQIQLIRQNISPDFDLIEWMREHAEKPCTIETGKEARRTVNGQVIVSANVAPKFSDDAVELVLARKQGRVVFDAVEISWRIRTVRTSPRVKRQSGVETFDADAIGDSIVLRHWQRGDRLQPIGMPAAAKIQDLFTNAKVPRSERHQRLLAATAGGEVFWAEGLRISERHKLRAETRRVLEWRWRRI
jgi:tRNA(Ile)-lysidine synthase